MTSEGPSCDRRQLFGGWGSLREATSTEEGEGRPGGEGGLFILDFSPFRLRQTEINPDGHKVTFLDQIL